VRPYRPSNRGCAGNRAATLTGVSLKPVRSWRPGHFIWPEGRTKIVLVGGIGTRTGDAERSFAGLLRYLAEQGGFDPRRDVLEGTFAGNEANGTWKPSVYTPPDTRRPLIDMAEALAGCLDFYRLALPSDSRLCVVGYSIGGVVALDGATLAVARDREGWRARLGAVVTLAAPVRGCSIGALLNWAWVVMGDADGLGDAGRDLDERWTNVDEQTRLERRAAFLRTSGARVLTLTDPDDSVVRPEEALLPAPGEFPADLQVTTHIRRPGSLGHGAILDEPSTWRRILAVVGPQSGAASPDPRGNTNPEVEEDLEELKARLRREGRIR
jgi:hypothetical protein